MAMGVDHTRHNLGLEAVNCSLKLFDYREVELNHMIDGLKLTNTQIKIISDAMNKLSHAKQKDKKFDISRDEEAKKIAYLVHLRNPTIFENRVHNLPVEDSDLEQKLEAIVDQMRKEGIPDHEINYAAMLERIPFESNIRFDVLDESAIEVVVQGLGAELEMLKSDLNQGFMNINTKYDDRTHVDEQMRSILKGCDEESKSHIRKTARGG